MGRYRVPGTTEVSLGVDADHPEEAFVTNGISYLPIEAGRYTVTIISGADVAVVEMDCWEEEDKMRCLLKLAASYGFSAVLRDDHQVMVLKGRIPQTAIVSIEDRR